MIKLSSCEIENLRGYSNAKVTFDDWQVFVGENNEGKSSILRMIEFLVNDADEALLMSQRALMPDEADLWMPANDSHHRARRITLRFSIRDSYVVKTSRRKKKRRTPLRNIDFRFSIRKSDLTARLNVGPPRRSEVTDTDAVKTFLRLRKRFRVELIPAVRNASSSRFVESFATLTDEIIGRKLIHDRQGGATTEYRLALSAIRDIGKIVERNESSMGETSLRILHRMMKSSQTRLELGVADILKLIRDNLHLAMSTGSHDASMVSPSQVGNGLQSVLDIALAIDKAIQSNRNTFLFVEEPEAFLHPSAQRELVAALREYAAKANSQVAVTTHSPIVLDECRFPTTVLVRDQRFYSPSLESDKREEINTALLAMPHAEAFFASGVLLVEGPGDRSFFQTLFSRLRVVESGSCLNKLVVQETGSKTSFAPWINLFRAYGTSADRPIKWLALFDADAAQCDGERSILETLKHSGYSLPTSDRKAIEAFGDAEYNTTVGRARLAKAANQSLARFSCRLLKVDLEWMILSGNAPQVLDFLESVGEQIELFDFESVKLVAKKLGSKVLEGKSASKSKKAPYIRAKLASQMPLSLISKEAISVIKAAMMLVTSKAQADRIWSEALASDSE